MKKDIHNLVQGVRNREAVQQFEFQTVHRMSQNLEQLNNEN